ncbi:COQ9 family protein [Caulobacter sp. UNC279MFTsu5.1]|uniref:COQ9 family protein n=1 Tax=Caulobacter sp. UNC279MFTsu5.1 TaxID=1502775 RepID=UPI0008E0D7EA|nr:COQ9 family protein [Caulobacter sp. UNC279MFTsu5.1]SFI85056.1 ubiquinone biosynthesis protein COQ9 [Caulobacter sp. UNC279MFTsu5.1]
MSDKTAEASQDPGQDPGDWADAAEQRVLDEALRLAPRLGWNPGLARAAAVAAGLNAGEAQLLLPQGPRDLAALLSRRHDRAALAALGALSPPPAKIRDKIRAGVIARLDAARQDAEALRKLAAFLAFPTHMPLALTLVWESADALWRWAGDTATDENHYSKRAILSGILVSTLAVDMASGRESALKHLDGRIDNVMAFEKWKAGIKPMNLAAEVAAALARMRYGRG